LKKYVTALGATLLLASSLATADAHEHSRQNRHTLLKTAAAHHTRLDLGADGQSGIASVYWGEKTANGQYAYAHALTAAHKTLPFGTLVRVTNKKNGHSVVVRINDRGPYVNGRIIDLTPAGAKAIGSSGLAQVMLSIVGRA
jgi:rare lipoprotein A